MDKDLIRAVMKKYAAPIPVPGTTPGTGTAAPSRPGTVQQKPVVDRSNQQASRLKGMGFTVQNMLNSPEQNFFQIKAGNFTAGTLQSLARLPGFVSMSTLTDNFPQGWAQGKNFNVMMVFSNR